MPAPTYERVTGEIVNYRDPDREDLRRTGRENSWVAGELRDHHHEIVRMMVLGMNNVQIARRFSLTPEQISNIRNSPVAKDKLEVLQVARDASVVDVREEIASLGPTAVGLLREAVETGVVKGRELSGACILKEANNLLDREIGKATQTVETKNAHVHFTNEDIEEIKRKAREMGRAANQIKEQQENDDAT